MQQDFQNIGLSTPNNQNRGLSSPGNSGIGFGNRMGGSIGPSNNMVKPPSMGGMGNTFQQPKPRFGTQPIPIGGGSNNNNNNWQQPPWQQPGGITGGGYTGLGPQPNPWPSIGPSNDFSIGNQNQLQFPQDMNQIPSGGLDLNSGSGPWDNMQKPPQIYGGGYTGLGPSNNVWGGSSSYIDPAIYGGQRVPGISY